MRLNHEDTKTRSGFWSPCALRGFVASWLRGFVARGFVVSSEFRYEKQSQRHIPAHRILRTLRYSSLTGYGSPTPHRSPSRPVRLRRHLRRAGEGAIFRGIDRALAERGHPLVVSRVHPTGSVELRARQLKENILRGLKSVDAERKKVLIIAHSMGGLDARYMISKLGMDDRVAGLLTITTPHRGSPYADWCIENLGKKLGGLKLMKLLGLDVQAIHDLTTERCKRFNRAIKNVPGVQYFSVSAAQAVAPGAAVCAASASDHRGGRGGERQPGLREELNLGRAPGRLAGGSFPRGQPQDGAGDQATDGKHRAAVDEGGGSGYREACLRIRDPRSPRRRDREAPSNRP